jgi:heme/copper-type cytochrome/quinol oxidase subunit 2
MRKTFLKVRTFFMMLMLLPIMSFASTQDNLGVQNVWDKIDSWLQDGYIQKIIAAIFFVVGVMRAMQSILQFFIMLGFAVLIFNAQTIIEKLAGATF